jgi:hypothetical protein
VLGLALNLLGFLNGFYTAQAMDILIDSGAYSEAATIFAVRIGIGAAAFAIVGRGNLGQGLGFLAGLIGWAA